MYGSYLRASLLCLLLGSCSFVVGILETDEESVASIDASVPADAGPSIDAMVVLPDASTAGCTTVLPDGTCEILCEEASCAGGTIVCPEGRPCVVDCINNNMACRDTDIDCSLATSCDITCTGNDACGRSAISCDGPRCNIACEGNNSCKDDRIDCLADTCVISCSAGNACNTSVCCDGVTCSAAQCTKVGQATCTCVVAGP